MKARRRVHPNFYAGVGGDEASTGCFLVGWLQAADGTNGISAPIGSTIGVLVLMPDKSCSERGAKSVEVAHDPRLKRPAHNSNQNIWFARLYTERHNVLFQSPTIAGILIDQHRKARVWLIPCLELTRHRLQEIRLSLVWDRDRRD
jgi:hypothetical protein